MKIVKVSLNLIMGSLLMTFLFTTMWSCQGREDKQTETGDGSPTTEMPISYNIYVENSGSMVGYCNFSNTNALETLIGDYYDRITSLSNDQDSITLNFVNTNIECGSSEKNAYLKSIKGKCKATYTKIDDMLTMMMKGVTDNDVNIMVSDFVFTTNEGNFSTAASQITQLFTKQLKARKDLSVAIFKYMRDFNGIYYPGGIPCNRPLPIYVWVFGKDTNVKKFADMPFNTQKCGEYFLQLSQSPEFVLNAINSRMITKDKKRIYVSKWNAVRHENYYEFVVEIDLSNSLLTKNEILNKTCYKITSNTSAIYNIVKIESSDGKKYKYTIRTKKPSPGIITIQYPIQTPVWVAESNFEGSGLPSDSTTLGIKYLIDGVSKAFNDVSKNKYNYFEININLE